LKPSFLFGAETEQKAKEKAEQRKTIYAWQDTRAKSGKN